VASFEFDISEQDAVYLTERCQVDEKGIGKSTLTKVV
jgi:hypothetical protein